MLAILKYPNNILTTPSEDISSDILDSSEVQTLIDNMIPTMYAAEGIGLAAPQVGQLTRLCIIGKEAEDALQSDLVLINPRWKKLSKKKGSDTEGCLSIPNVFGKVKRWRDIVVEALDRHGNPIAFDASGLFARVIQHEVDHLDGVLFIDKATGIYRVD